MSWIKKLYQFYKRSHENRLQIKLFLGFVVIPVVGLALLYAFAVTYMMP